jgi:hypothetical protein
MKLVSMVIALLALPLAGCAPQELDDGYQFGDITRMSGRELAELEEARQAYCQNHKDSPLRKAALDYIRIQHPEIPENGICL